MSMIDYIAITGEKDSKRIEFVDHLHEHFIDPCLVENGAYMAPSCPGFSIEMKSQTLVDYAFQPAVAAQ
jgi:L-fuconate dehydratase